MRTLSPFFPPELRTMRALSDETFGIDPLTTKFPSVPLLFCRLSSLHVEELSFLPNFEPVTFPFPRWGTIS